MPAHLDGLHTRPAWFTYLGALGGCLDYLGVEVSPGWLYGGTGLAFILNMRADVEVGSPIAWDWLCVNPCQPTNPGMVPRLAPNLGYETRDVCGCPHGEYRDLERARERAWQLVRESLDEGLPCLGYELAYPEFFIITGYADEGYTFLMPGSDGAREREAGPKPWQEISPAVQWVRVQAVLPGTPAPDDAVVREALRAATRQMTQRPAAGDFILGLIGYDLWAEALEHGRADGFGHRYNAACWAELRAQAVAFLREARERLPGRADALLDEAVGHYGVVAEKLQALHALHPFLDVQGDRIRSQEAAGLVRDAAAAERQGLPLLARIADALD